MTRLIAGLPGEPRVEARFGLRPIRQRPSLRGRAPRPRTTSPKSGTTASVALAGPVLLLVIGLYVAQLADIAAQGPVQSPILAVLLTLPVAASALSWWSGRSRNRHPRRAARIIADRRPVLLQQRLRKPSARPRRIVGPAGPPVRAPFRAPLRLISTRKLTARRGPRLIFARRPS